MSKEKQPKGWRRWLKETLIFLLIALSIGWAADLWRSQSLVSGKAPELSAQSLLGKNIDLIAMSKEKPVLVYFWATWCSVCSTVSPSVNFISNHYQVVSVALNSGETQRIKQYLNAKAYRFNVINDAQGEISREWGVSVTPTIFIIADGQINSVTTGFTSPMGMWLRLLFS